MRAIDTRRVTTKRILGESLGRGSKGVVDERRLARAIVSLLEAPVVVNPTCDAGSYYISGGAFHRRSSSRGFKWPTNLLAWDRRSNMGITKLSLRQS